jgi:uncharacterized protein (DUF885 family)
MNRRHFLLSSGALALLAATAKGAMAKPASAADARLNAAFDAIFNEAVDASPQSATDLGLDKGRRAAVKAKLDDNSARALTDHIARTRKAIDRLKPFDPATLSDGANLNLDVVRYMLEDELVGPTRYGVSSPQSPYRISQQDGAYFNIPDFLDTSHVIATRADCEAYLSRLAAFATALDNDSDVQRADAARGYGAPVWSLDLALGQMRALRGPAPADSGMTTSLATRAAKAGIAGDWTKRVARIIESRVYPALDRQIALVEAIRGTTAAGDGVWRLPQGEALYADALREATTTDMTPDEVHALGLAQVAEISAQLDAILEGEGMTQGSVGARLTALNTRPDQLYADSAAGRAALIASLNAGYADIKARLPRAFNNPPDVPLDIRAVPVEIQDGAPNGYYRSPPLDNSRPALYFINLKSVGDWPKYSLPALTYHEGVPGHHLQLSTMQGSTDIPMLRKVQFLSAYGEGWALYAEQLADELGAYKSPLERAGYLQSFLFRAARLVVDTGLNARRWTREQATQYLVDTTGFARPRSQREVERYCALPGQACSYKVGHAAWVRARQKAQAALGDRFDLRYFHDVLRDGSMPLSILEKRIAARTAAAMKA